MGNTILFGIVIVVLYLWSTINILKEYERGVIFRLGRLVPDAYGPGLIFVFWPIYKMVRVSLRTITLEGPPQESAARLVESLRQEGVL